METKPFHNHELDPGTRVKLGPRWWRNPGRWWRMHRWLKADEKLRREDPNYRTLQDSIEDAFINGTGGQDSYQGILDSQKSAD